MRAGYRVTLGILTIMILITMTIGTSYSFYSVSDEQDTANNLTSTCFKINFAETNNDNINLTTAYPMDDSKALQGKPHTFSITNTCTQQNSNESVKFKIVLGSTSESDADLLEHIRYKLVESTGSAEVPGEELGKEYSGLPGNVKSTYGLSGLYLLKDNETLDYSATKSYKLYLWIDSAAGNEVMTKTFKGKILVYADI